MTEQEFKDTVDRFYRATLEVAKEPGLMSTKMMLSDIGMELLTEFRRLSANEKYEEPEWIKQFKINSVSFGSVSTGQTGVVAYDYFDEDWEAYIFVNDDPKIIAAQAKGPTIPAAIQAALEKMKGETK